MLLSIRSGIPTTIRLSRRLAHGMFWVLAGSAGTRILTLLTTICVARLLGKEMFGELSVIQGTVGMFEVFAGLSLGLTATKYVAECRNSDPARAGRILALSELMASAGGLMLAAGMFLAASWLANQVLAAPTLTPLLRIGAALLFLSALNGAQMGALAGFEAFRTIAWVNLLCGLLGFPVAVAGVLVGGASGALWASAGCMAVNVVVNSLALRWEAKRAGVRLDFAACWQERRILWGFSLPATLAGTLVVAGSWICATLLVNEPGGYAEMGLFSAANQWFLAILFLPTALGRAVFPVLSEEMTHRRKEARLLLLASVALNGLLTLPFLLLALCWGGQVMSLYGQDFSQGRNVLLIVVATAALLAIQTPVGQVVAASGRMWSGLAMNLGWALVLTAMTWRWLAWGALGLAMARLVAYVVHAVWTFHIAYLLLVKQDEETPHA